MRKILVIGGNAAGMSFAAKYKRNNQKDEITVIESLDKASFGACGLPYFAEGNFDKEETLYARSPEAVRESGIIFETNTTVTNIDTDKKIVYSICDDQEKTYSYDKLIISSGANAFVPDFINLSDSVQTLTSIEDGKLLKNKLIDNNINHITVVGGGFIGLEVISAALDLGKKVTLIERSQNILNTQFDQEFYTNVEQYLISKGVELKTGENLVGIDSDLKITTDKSNFQTDHVVVSIGFKPNTSFITSVEKLPNGAILTDENFQSNLNDIYAIGDCASVINSVTNKPTYIALATTANKQGRALADKLANIDNEFSSMIGSSALKICDLDIARTGLTTTDCEKEGINYKYKVITDKTHTAYYPNQEDIQIGLIYDADSLVILGGQVLGKKDVVHRLNTIALAIQAKITTKQLGYIDFAYAPPFSRTWEALNVAGNVSK